MVDLLNIKQLKNKFNGIFFRTFVLMMLLSITIVFMFCGMAYRFMYTNVEEKMKKSNEYLIERIAANVDYSIGNVEQILNLISKDNNVIDAAMIPGIMSEEKYERNINILNLLTDTAENNPCVEKLLLYETKERGLYTSYGSMYNADTFFGREIVETCIESDNLINEKNSDRDYIKIVVIDGKIYMVKEFLYSISEPLSVLIAEMNTNVILGGAYDVSGGDIFPLIADSQSNLILNNTDIKSNVLEEIKRYSGKINEKLFWKDGYLVYKSDYSSWFYILPHTENMAELTFKQSVVLVMPVIIMFLAISFAVSYLVSKSIYKPINKIVDIAKESNTDEVKNEIDFLASTIIKSKEKRSHMQSVINTISHEATGNYLKRIIFEKEVSTNEIVKSFAELNSPFSEKGKYSVITAKADDEIFNKEFGQKYILDVKSVMDKMLTKSDETYSVLLEKTQLLIIVRFSDALDEIGAEIEKKDITESIVKKTKSYAAGIHLSSGEIYGHLGGIKYSYEDCINKSAENSVKDEKHHFETYIYHLEQELNNSDTPKVKVFAQQLTKEIVDSGIGKAEKAALYKKIFVDVIDTAVKNNLGDMADEISALSAELLENYDESEIVKQICRICCEVSETLQINKKKSFYGYLSEAKKYIEENYADSNLSLGTVSEKIGINKAYLSSLFNENLKTGFLDYLNGKRIEKAKELLINTDMPVKDIAVSVGFSTVQTFIRVFKKIEGVPPGAFRKK